MMPCGQMSASIWSPTAPGTQVISPLTPRPFSPTLRALGRRVRGEVGRDVKVRLPQRVRRTEKLRVALLDSHVRLKWCTDHRRSSAHASLQSLRLAPSIASPIGIPAAWGYERERSQEAAYQPSGHHGSPI